MVPLTLAFLGRDPSGLGNSQTSPYVSPVERAGERKCFPLCRPFCQRRNRLRHLLRRFGFYLIALWASATLNFIIPRLTPGNPAQALMARMHGRINPKALHSLEIAFGVSHDPLWT